MNKKKILVSKNLSLIKAISLINKNSINGVFVINKKKQVIGILMDSDIRKYLLAKTSIKNTKVEDIITEGRDILFIVGAEKVPAWVFELSDYNIAIGNQPHSEVAALAIAMNKLCPNSYNTEFDGKLSVIPSATHREMKDSS